MTSIYICFTVPSLVIMIIIYTDVNKKRLTHDDFVVMMYKNEQPITAYLCRGWVRLENDFNLICR